MRSLLYQLEFALIDFLSAFACMLQMGDVTFFFFIIVIHAAN